MSVAGTDGTAHSDKNNKRQSRLLVQQLQANEMAFTGQVNVSTRLTRNAQTRREITTSATTASVLASLNLW